MSSGKKLAVEAPTIYVTGGIVQGVEGFRPGARFDVIDYDIEGADPEKICRCRAGDGPHYHGTNKADKDGKW